MKRSGLILLISFFAVLFTNAQLRIAVVGGVHSSSVKETNDLSRWDSISNNYSSRTGIHFGFMADLPLSATSKLYFQPGIVFYNKGRKYAAPYDSVGTVKTFSSSQFVNYIDIPLNLVLKFSLGKKTKFMIGGGPYASFFYNGKEKTETLFNSGNYESTENNDLPVGKKPGQYKVINYGVNAIAGIEFIRWFLNGNFSRGLGDFYTTDAYAGHLNHQVIGGTIGIYLGKPVQMEPKIKDKDKDGIVDSQDDCPTQAGTAATHGCPDKDADGIADKTDQCPDEPGLASNHGCPVRDKDNDGVTDDLDKCPDVAGLIKYNGCPIPDSDKDGVNDEEDKCPTVAGVARYNGCPIPDSDKDGINDEEDKCPTVAGIKANNGCPEIKKEIIEKVNFAARRIQFEKAKADLLPASLKVLDEVAAIFNQNPDLKLSIEGHTSNEGNYDVNMELSKQRAETVKEYLITKGIDSKRLRAEGFGPNKPLNNSKTPAEMALNRRVELKLSNQ
jgi:outer membrane protein OmpA-like peptidoglycan-associated protein